MGKVRTTSRSWFIRRLRPSFFKRLILFLKMTKKQKDIEIKREPKWVKPELLEEKINLGWFYNEKKSQFRMARVNNEDRRTHFYIVGSSGSGKTKLLEFLIFQDIVFKRGLGVIDPEGDLIKNVLGILSISFRKSLENDIVLIDPLNKKEVVNFNPLEKVEGVPTEELALQLTEVFKKIWHESWGARMEEMLTNSFIALAENNLTLAELPFLLTDSSFRNRAILRIENPITRQYFKVFDSWSPKMRSYWSESTLNKINAFLVDNRIRHILCNPKSSFNLRDLIDNRRVLLVKLNRSRLPGSSDLLASLLMTKIKLASFSREDTPIEERIPWHLFVDEFQNFATNSFVEILSEARKYRLSLIFCHQNLNQLPEKLISSVLANCGTQCYFRTSREDAEILSKEAFRPTGEEVKQVYLSSGYQFYPLSEEREQYIQQLQDLPNRNFLSYHKKAGARIFLQTEYMKEFRDINPEIGKNYLISREKIEKDYQKRIKNILKSGDPEPGSFRRKINN